MKKDHKKTLFLISLGNALEFYDFALYAFLIPKISVLFFPFDDVLNSYIFAFTIFAVGFLSRPLGGIIYGYIGDREGRKKALLYALLFMAITTMTIGLLPTYNDIGVLAPICLAICRILQGVIIGGEFTGSLIFISESLKNEKYKALYTSIVASIGVMGWFLGIMVVSIFTQDNSPDYYWRIPFFFGAITALIGYYIRNSLIEQIWISSLIKKNTIKYPLLYIFQNNLKSIAIGVGIGGVMGVLFYGQFIYQNTFLISIIGVDKKFAQQATTWGIGLYMILLPFFGYVADKLGRALVMKSFSLGIVCLSYFIYYLISMGTNFTIILSLSISAILLSGFFAPATYVITQLFKIEVRCTGVSLGYNLGASILGGLTPTISLLFYKFTDSALSPFIFLFIIGIYGFIISLMCQKYIENPLKDI